jgi:hypothetical protein
MSEEFKPSHIVHILAHIFSKLNPSLSGQVAVGRRKERTGNNKLKWVSQTT